MHRWLLLLVIATSPVLAQDQSEDGPARPPREKSQGGRMAELREKALKLIETSKRFENWDEQYELVMSAVDKIYDRNGWDTEADLFSLELTHEVGALPPWDVQGRYETFKDMVSERYLLDDRQQEALQQVLFQKSLQVFSQHADRILEYSLEAIETRASGEPFTPEQIARWATLAAPVMAASRQAMKEGAEQLMEELDPEQRELVQADLNATNARLDTVMKMADGWRRGNWTPDQWGLEEDPIQNAVVVMRPEGEPGPTPDGQNAAGEAEPQERSGGAGGAAGAGGADPQRGRAERGEPPAAEDGEGAADEAAQRAKADRRAPTADTANNDPWAAYVREFIQRYGLNNEQQQRCWLIYNDSSARRDAFEKRFQRRAKGMGLATSQPAQAASEEWKRDKERLFERMKARLERIPTRAQRKAATP